MEHQLTDGELVEGLRTFIYYYMFTNGYRDSACMFRAEAQLPPIPDISRFPNLTLIDCWFAYGDSLLLERFHQEEELRATASEAADERSTLKFDEQNYQLSLYEPEATLVSSEQRIDGHNHKGNDESIVSTYTDPLSAVRFDCDPDVETMLLDADKLLDPSSFERHHISEAEQQEVLQNKLRALQDTAQTSPVVNSENSVSKIALVPTEALHEKDEPLQVQLPETRTVHPQCSNLRSSWSAITAETSDAVWNVVDQCIPPAAPHAAATEWERGGSPLTVMELGRMSHTDEQFSNWAFPQSFAPVFTNREMMPQFSINGLMDRRLRFGTKTKPHSTKMRIHGNSMLHRRKRKPKARPFSLPSADVPTQTYLRRLGGVLTPTVPNSSNEENASKEWIFFEESPSSN